LSAVEAGLDRDDRRLRFHDLRHTFASHLIIDIRLDVVQVSRILGQARTRTSGASWARRGPRLVVRRFTAEHMTGAFASLYEELLSAGR
jgi:integrase